MPLLEVFWAVVGEPVSSVGILPDQCLEREIWSCVGGAIITGVLAMRLPKIKSSVDAILGPTLAASPLCQFAPISRGLGL